jgi:hypothetical protein
VTYIVSIEPLMEVDFEGLKEEGRGEYNQTPP